MREVHFGHLREWEKIRDVVVAGTLEGETCFDAITFSVHSKFEKM